MLPTSSSSLTAQIPSLTRPSLTDEALLATASPPAHEVGHALDGRATLFHGTEAGGIHPALAVAAGARHASCAAPSSLLCSRGGNRGGHIALLDTPRALRPRPAVCDHGHVCGLWSCHTSKQPVNSSINQSLTQSLTTLNHSLTHSLHSIIHSIIHSINHSLNQRF